MNKVLLLAVFPCLGWALPAPTQTGPETGWQWSAQLSGSFFPGQTSWNISHPIYNGAGVTWETFRGEFTHRYQLQAGFELRKGRIAVRATLGVLPQRFTQEEPARDDRLGLVLAGLSIVLYPVAESNGRPEPYVAVGAGGQKATGDMDNTGYYLSGAAGVRIPLGRRIALDAGVALYRLKYTQVDLAPAIAKDVAAWPVALTLGVRLGG